LSLRADIALVRGGFALDVQLEVAPGETVVLVGPNGSGKTSCLLAIAGLLPLARGRIVLGDVVLDGGSAGPRLPPAARDVGVVFQDHLLFPTMSVLDNVAYGLRCRGMPRGDAHAAAAGWLRRLGVGDLADAQPCRLSGGQAQRVALARALAPSPRLVLLDEPLAAVDVSAKLQLRRELRAHLRAFGGVRLAVVHDIADALALADRIVVLEAGRVVQAGTIAEIVGKPKSRFVADLVGVNCFFGTCRGGMFTTAGGQLVVASELQGEAIATLHPRAVSLFRERPAGSPRNVWRAPVLALETTLERVRVQLGGAIPVVAEVTVAAVHDLGLADGGEVWVAVKATEVVVAPA
jgi:molybdate transport system ATP-binding protein